MRGGDEAHAVMGTKLVPPMNTSAQVESCPPDAHLPLAISVSLYKAQLMTTDDQ